jgi:hypothetical protein
MGKPSNSVFIERHLLKCAAWFSLGGAAPQVYMLFRTKCQMGRLPGKPGKRDWMILNNGEITFSYREAKRNYGITAPRFRRAIDELVEKGFIDVEASGMGVQKVATQYRVSDRWRDYGTPSFREAERPKPSIANPGFKRGNKLSPMASRKKSSDENVGVTVYDSVGVGQ